MLKRKILAFSILAAMAALACNLTGTIPATQTPQTSPTSLPPLRTVEITVTSQPTEDEGPDDQPHLTEVPTANVMGTITGHVNYPSEYIPAQRVVAFDVNDPSKFFYVDTVDGQSDYSLEVPQGNYYVVSYKLKGGTLSAGFSQAVPCGLSVDCTDHSLIPVQVMGGSLTEEINPLDWYAPQGAFPPNPTQ